MRDRFNREPQPYKLLTKRDYSIVEAVFEARYLTLEQIGRLFFGGKVTSRCKMRVRLLFDRGYLRKRSVYVNEPDIHFLGLKGRRHIARIHPIFSQEEVDRIAGVAGGETPAPNIFMEHDLTLSTLYVRARLEAYSLGHKLAWENARMLELQKLGFQPDAYLAVFDGTTVEAYLEFTSELDGLGKKVEAYDRFAPEATVFWVTTSLRKLDRIGEAVVKSCRPQRFYLGLVEECRDFLTNKVWVVYDGEWRKTSLMGGRSA